MAGPNDGLEESVRKGVEEGFRKKAEEDASKRPESQQIEYKFTADSNTDAAVDRLETAVVGAEKRLTTHLLDAMSHIKEILFTGYDALSEMTQAESANIQREYLRQYGDIRDAYTENGLEIERIGNESTRKQIERLESLRNNQRLLDDQIFESQAEIIKASLEMTRNIGEKSINAFNAMSDKTLETALRFSETMEISSDKTADLILKQYARTGDSSEKILSDVYNQAKAVGKATGIPLKILADDISDVISDMNTFTKTTIDSSARMAASIRQVGLSLEGFKALLTPYRDFETSAKQMGDLSAMFGIQMDAMEMMYLANEDEELFLKTMRENLLDEGLDVETMSGTRQRALANALNMSVDQMKIFMRQSENVTAAIDSQVASQEGLSTSAKDIASGFENLNNELSKQILKSLKSTEEISARIADKMFGDAASSIVHMSDVAAGESNKLTQTIIGNSNKVTEFVNSARTGFNKLMAGGTAEVFGFLGKGLDEANKSMNSLFMTTSEATATLSTSMDAVGDAVEENLIEPVKSFMQTIEEYISKPGEKVVTANVQVKETDIASVVRSDAQTAVDNVTFDSLSRNMSESFSHAVASLRQQVEAISPKIEAAVVVREERKGRIDISQESERGDALMISAISDLSKSIASMRSQSAPTPDISADISLAVNLDGQTLVNKIFNDYKITAGLKTGQTPATVPS